MANKSRSKSGAKKQEPKAEAQAATKTDMVEAAVAAEAPAEPETVSTGGVPAQAAGAGGAGEGAGAAIEGSLGDTSGSGLADAGSQKPDSGAGADTDGGKPALTTETAPLVAVIERTRVLDPSHVAIDIPLTGRELLTFVVSIDDLPQLAGKQLSEATVAIADNREAIVVDGVTVSLAALKAAWEAEYGRALYPDLEWPIDAPQESDSPGRPPTDDELRMIVAGHAAAAVYAGNGDFDGGYLGGRAEAMPAAAAFVRANPTAPANAIPIELRLKGFRDVPQGGLRVMSAWRVFAFTLRELDRLAAEEKALAEAEAKAAQPAPRPTAHADQLALMPSKEPFSPTGFSTRR